MVSNITCCDDNRSLSKKIINLLKKRPVICNLYINNHIVCIDLPDLGISKVFPIDTSVEEKRFIFQLETWLRDNVYPKMISVQKKSNFSKENLKDIILGKVDLSEKTETEYTIIKYISGSNHTIIEDSDGLASLYVFRYPFTEFLLKSYKWDKYKTWDFFSRHSEFLYFLEKE